MTDVPPPSIPPSIPPRERPASGTGARTVTTVHGRGADGADGHAQGGSPALRAPVSHPAPAPRPAFPQPERPAPAAPERRTSARAERQAAAPAPGADAPGDDRDDEQDDEQDGPSPLAVAVDRTGLWLRKAAGTTGTTLTAAYSSLTHPRPKDEPMTAHPEAPTIPPRTSATGLGTGAVPSARPTSGRTPVVGAGPRRVRLAVSRVDPWSVMKLAFLLAFAAGIMLVVAVSVLWLTLNELHVFASVNDLVQQIVGQESPIDVLSYVAFDKVLSVTTLIAVLDVFLLTALSTIGAFLYNVVAALVGGVHVTMTDE